MVTFSELTPSLGFPERWVFERLEFAFLCMPVASTKYIHGYMLCNVNESGNMNI